MPSGKHTPRKPAKRRHMAHFDKAMKQALQNWDPANGEEQQVVFRVTVSPNPGGIKEYHVDIEQGQ